MGGSAAYRQRVAGLHGLRAHPPGSLQLDKDTLCAGSPYQPDNADAASALAEVRRLLAAGEYRAAEGLASTTMMARPLAQMPYGTLDDLLLCTSLWDHRDYSRDDALLERLYPLMKGAPVCFLDTLVPDPAGRGLTTSPSLSPENQHPSGAALCAGPAMDRQILRDLFDRTIDAGRRLALDAALLEQFASARRDLAPDRVGELGQLQEWLEDWDAAAPEQQHRHVSHLYAGYPSHQLNVRDTPEMSGARPPPAGRMGRSPRSSHRPRRDLRRACRRCTTCRPIRRRSRDRG